MFPEIDMKQQINSYLTLKVRKSLIIIIIIKVQVIVYKYETSQIDILFLF